MITSRFYDGDPSNNFYCRDRIKFNAAGEPEDAHWRGDFKGLIERLDYIRDLGFTAIWITPPVENRSGLDYHDYHRYDWTRTDPRLESPGATYQDLIDAAHAQLHDSFTNVEIVESEEVGFFPKGQGRLALADGATRLGGLLPINPSGGLKAKGHPTGATGVGQAHEIVLQLRGGAAKRQVKDARVGFTCNFGGFGNNVVCLIFKREG